MNSCPYVKVVFELAQVCTCSNLFSNHYLGFLWLAFGSQGLTKYGKKREIWDHDPTDFAIKNTCDFYFPDPCPLKSVVLRLSVFVMQISDSVNKHDLFQVQK